MKRITSESGINFKALFESSPGSYLVLSPDLRIVAVSDAYANSTMTKREEIIGKQLFEVFPNNPDDYVADGVVNLKSSLDFVLKNKALHTMAVQKYDIRRRDGTFEERYWSPLNKPVLSKSNEVEYIIHRVEDVTDLVLLQKLQSGSDKRESDLHDREVQLESELVKHAKDIQKLNQDLEQKVAERTSQLESVSKTITDYKLALDAASIVAITDQKGTIKHVNDNFCKISKYTREELIGQDHRIINSGYHPKSFIRSLWVTIANGKIWKGELRNRAKDGTIYWVDTTIVPFLNDEGKPYQYVAIRSDITPRKKAEEQILKLNNELETKVKERTLELTDALGRETELNEIKSRFVSMASHEFRTPLSTILSSISLVETYDKPELADKRAKHIERIKSSVKNLTEILNDFLSLDKLEQGKVVAENTDFGLQDFINEIVDEMDGIVKKKSQQINFHYSGPNEVFQDKKILRNVMLNLLSNASKYSVEKKHIGVLVNVDDAQVKIEVKDKGIGIPEEDQKHLFTKFFRARNTDTIQGTGLGLSIVKHYVELMNGTIDFVSIPDNGTTFTVIIPRMNQ